MKRLAAVLVSASLLGAMCFLPGTAVATDKGMLSATTASSGSASLTYDQIMTRVAHYPGPEEPQYVPADGEQIWLTDLEGHASIYDNDSISINYAPGYNRGQITGIEVYRNDVKMRFLPPLFDVLTNEQMKTFDGNPDEKTPASRHTDHAIWGYTYRFVIVASGENVTLSTRVRSPVAAIDPAYANIGSQWAVLLMSDEAALRGLRAIKDMGFEGVQFSNSFYMASDKTNDIFAQYTYDTTILPSWSRTMTDKEVLWLLRLIRQAGLKAELRVELWITEAYTRTHPQAARCCITPPSWDAWFANYTALCVHMAQLADQGECAIFTPLVELGEAERRTDRVLRLLDAVAAVFSGEICVSQCTVAALGDVPLDLPKAELWRQFDTRLGSFWTWSRDGRNLAIGMEWWPGYVDLGTSADQCFSAMLEQLVRFFGTVVEYFRARYPGHGLRFSELGSFDYDGATAADRHPVTARTCDHQEFADAYAALLAGTAALGVTANVWSLWLESGPDWHSTGYQYLDWTTALAVVEAIVGEAP